MPTTFFFCCQYLGMNHCTVSHFTYYLINESSLLGEVIQNCCENVYNASLLLKACLLLELSLFVNKALQGQNLVDLEIQGHAVCFHMVLGVSFDFQEIDNQKRSPDWRIKREWSERQKHEKEINRIILLLSTRIKPHLGESCNWEIPSITFLKVISTYRKSFGPQQGKKFVNPDVAKLK